MSYQQCRKSQSPNHGFFGDFLIALFVVSAILIVVCIAFNIYPYELVDKAYALFHIGG